MDILDYLVMELERHGLTADARYTVYDGLDVLLWKNNFRVIYTIETPDSALSIVAENLVKQFTEEYKRINQLTMDLSK